MEVRLTMVLSIKKTLFHNYTIQKLRLVAIVLFAIIGVVIVLRAFASNTNEYFEAEEAVLSGGAVIISEEAASGQTYIKFSGLASNVNGPLQPHSLGFAPFAYVAWGDVSLDETRAATGVQHYIAAFMLGAGGCSPTWGGESVNDLDSSRSTIIANDISSIRSHGGDVMVSFGGQAGTELAIACGSTTSLKDAYKRVIDRYGLSMLDFDIEGPATSDEAANQRRVEAIRELQQEMPNLKIWLTLAVNDPGGLDGDGRAIIQDMKNGGVVIAGVNIMVMDYAFDSRDMAQAAINAAEATFNQLKNIYGDSADDATIWKAIGLIPMIGQNDTQPEVFTLANAQTLHEYAVQKGIGLVSMWNVNRDESCPGGGGYVSDTCSGIDQIPFQFMDTLNMPALP